MNINVFYGENAQGKTNIIESIFLSSIGKSFRTSNEKELIRFGEEKAVSEIYFQKSDTDPALFDRICCWSHGSCIHMESADPCDRTVICNGKTFIYPRSSRLLDRRIFPAFTGSYYSTSSSAQ